MVEENEDKTKRIIATAVELAEQGGFDAVRMRDVANQAGVALGTFYKRFRSKEDLLMAALGEEWDVLQKKLRERPLQGATRLERVTAFFDIATKGFTRKPNLAKAVIRAVTSAESGLTGKVTEFHERMTVMIAAAIRGESLVEAGDKPSNLEYTVAYVLQHVWFASLVGWGTGVRTRQAVVSELRVAAELLLRGMAEIEKEAGD